MDQSDDIINWLFGFIKFGAVISFMWIGLEQGIEPYIDMVFSGEIRLLFCLLSLPIIYFFVAFPRVLKILINASNITNRLALQESRIRDLNNEVTTLKKRLDNYE
ncbi:hypothetical protein [Vibrio diabolicus]|uniref:hypothetical protein n=1 Tax=Vibrio diabolicus TaxID=50719 RepID=UPI0022A94463|nr:hypothetical protein [Vibrio diabolicus]MCZ2367769.1 hypothetical protein [Vibrio diabolicus]MDV5047598.1 hypothetical protein [Vibrio diabolicus]